MATARTFRRGFWRLALLAWLGGAVLLVWLADEPLVSPLANACASDEAALYAECHTAAPPAAESWLDRLLDTVRTPPAMVDATRVVPRWTTERWRDALTTLAVRAAWWTAIVWVPFYLLVWAFAGFTPRDEHARR